MAHTLVDVSNGPTDGRACCMSYNGDIQFIATNDAIKKSVDYGITWTDASPTMHDTANIKGMSTSSSGQYVTFAHDWDIIFTSSNYGVNWVTHDISQVGIEHIRYSGMSLNGQIQVVTFTNDDRVEGGLLISKDYGATWTRINSNNGDEYIAGARSLAITDDGSKIFFACTSGDSGNDDSGLIAKYEWDITSAPDTGSWSNITPYGIGGWYYSYDHIAISPNGSYIIASKSNDDRGIIESPDGGDSWDESLYVPIVGITVSRDGKFRCLLYHDSDNGLYGIKYSIEDGDWQYEPTNAYNNGGVACSYDAKYVTANTYYESTTFNTAAAAAYVALKVGASTVITNVIVDGTLDTGAIGTYFDDFNNNKPTATAVEKGELIVSMLSAIYKSEMTDVQKAEAKVAAGQKMAEITIGVPVTIDLSNLGDLTATFASKGYDILEQATDMYYNQYTETTGTGEVFDTVVYNLSAINAEHNTHLHVDVGYYIKYTYNGASAVFFAENDTTLQSVVDPEIRYRVKLSSESTENNIITVGTSTFKLNAFASTGLTPEGTVQCFVAGTRILTNNGYKAVEALRKTDKVVTADGRQVPFKLYTTHIKSASTSNAPFMIPAGTFGAKSPAANLVISPLHAIQSRKGVWQIPKYAAHTFEGITQINIGKSVTYYHVELPNFFKDNIVTDGTIVESFGASQVSGLKNVYKFNSKINGFTRISKPSTQAATKL
jgi:Hint domain